MKRLRKTISSLLAISILMSIALCAPFTVNAAGTANDIVNVAQGEVGVSGSPNKYTYWLGSIGGSYSYAWCHAFVSWCADQAGAGDKVPRTASCASGVSWFKSKNEWKSRSSGYTPKAGDIIYFDYGSNGTYDHVGIVTSSSGGRVYTIEGNARNAVKVNGGYSNGYSLSNTDILGYGTPSYSNNPTNAPTDVHLDRSQVWYDIQDDIVLYPRANDADYFWISVHKDGQELISQGLAVNSELRFSASQWGYGDYYAWITAANSAGNVDSVGINFSVVGAAGYNSVSVEKPFYDIDETVNISVSPVCAKGVVIGIDKANVGRVVTEQCDTTFSIAASQLGVGSYSSYFSVYNGSGGVDTSRVSFLIPERKNLGDEFVARIQNKSSQKYLKAVGDNVEGSDKIDDKKQLWLFVRLSDNSYKIKNYYDFRSMDVDNFAQNGAGTNVKVYEDWDCTAQRYYIYEIYGSYYIKPVCTDMMLDMSQTTNNLEVWGRGEDWAPQKFDIQKTTSLIHPAISLNKKNFNLDEKVTVTASAEGVVNYYGAQIWKGDKVVYQESFTGHTLDIDCSKFGAGDYGVFVSCVNNYGSINTETLQFHVTSGITNDVDLDNSVTVADATLLQKYVVCLNTLTDDQKLLADCNGDGKIDVRDATYIQKTIVKIPV